MRFEVKYGSIVEPEKSTFCHTIHIYCLSHACLRIDQNDAYLDRLPQKIHSELGSFLIHERILSFLKAITIFVLTTGRNGAPQAMRKRGRAVSDSAFGL